MSHQRNKYSFIFKTILLFSFHTFISNVEYVCCSNRTIWYHSYIILKWLLIINNILDRGCYKVQFACSDLSIINIHVFTIWNLTSYVNLKARPIKWIELFQYIKANMATISKSLPILCNRSLTLQSCKQIKCITFAHNFGSDAKDNYSQVISIIQFCKKYTNPLIA